MTAVGISATSHLFHGLKSQYTISSQRCVFVSLQCECWRPIGAEGCRQFLQHCGETSVPIGFKRLVFREKKSFFSVAVKSASPCPCSFVVLVLLRSYADRVVKRKWRRLQVTRNNWVTKFVKLRTLQPVLYLRSRTHKKMTCGQWRTRTHAHLQHFIAHIVTFTVQFV